MNLNKMVMKDAAEWARAEMFFGEGAGTRRKLLNAEIAQKGTTIPGYAEAFEEAYSMQDMAEHALKATKERRHIDRTAAVSKNAKAIMRGDRRGMSTGVLIVVGIAVVAHQTGYDEVAIKEIKKYYKKAKAEIAVRKLRHNFNKGK